jgi:aspartate ammonia-lyase
MTRIEHDLLGEMALPDEALYGIQTERARRAFDVSDRTVRPALIAAYARVKKACAAANAELGHLDEARHAAIAQACEEVAAGQHREHFITDALQGGAGTSTNMNVNEVIAHRAAQIGGIDVSPLAHVNRHQSTTDTYPTALRVAAIFGLHALEQAIVALQDACQDKERAFASVVKLGRTQLRDAVPTTLGREFGAWANALARDRWRVFKCVERLRVVNLGGTAIGTGIAAPRRYIFLAIDKLREETGLNLARAENLVEATQNTDVFVEVSGILKAHASTLVKMARDLRLLSSGPQGGLGEIELPAIQPGSSIMPGKINPVIPEMVMQAGFRIAAHDAEITSAVMAGELELNAFLPLVADALLGAISLLERVDTIFARDCIAGVTANEQRCRDLMERSAETATALIPAIGHERAVDLARLMQSEQLGIRDAVRRLDLLSDDALEALLTPEALCALGWRE